MGLWDIISVDLSARLSSGLRFTGAQGRSLLLRGAYRGTIHTGMMTPVRAAGEWVNRGPMKAVVYHRYGSTERLRLRDIPEPMPKAHQVLVKVHATSVNAWDWDLLTGKPLIRGEGPFRPKHKILGSDIAGIVEAVGKDVERFHPGDAVFGDTTICGWGGFAEYVAADADQLVAKPDGMSFVQAAASPQAATLALQALRRQRKSDPSQEILINGAGGGAGSFAVQIAKLNGASVTAVDHTSKLDFMSGVGADNVIDYTRDDYTRMGARYDLIIDMVARRSIPAYARTLKPGGTFTMAGGTLRAIIRAATIGSLISLFGNKRLGLLMWKPSIADLEHIKELFAAGTVRPFIDRTYSLAETPEALRHVGEGRAKGKVVVEVVAGVG